MKRRKPCPFCGSEPIVAEHAPKVNGEYQWMIACENPHCNFNPSAHGFVSSEYVIKAWNTRTPEECNCNSSRTSVSNPELCGACGKLIPPEEGCTCADHQGGTCSFCMEAKYDL